MLKRTNALQISKELWTNPEELLYMIITVGTIQCFIASCILVSPFVGFDSRILTLSSHNHIENDPTLIQEKNWQSGTLNIISRLSSVNWICVQIYTFSQPTLLHLNRTAHFTGQYSFITWLTQINYRFSRSRDISQPIKYLNIDDVIIISWACPDLDAQNLGLRSGLVIRCLEVCLNISADAGPRLFSSFQFWLLSFSLWKTSEKMRN